MEEWEWKGIQGEIERGDLGSQESEEGRVQYRVGKVGQVGIKN